jgi:GT2 family glycosyltransferase
MSWEPLVYAVTLNWNRAGETLECLSSLARQTYPRLSLLVVDNGSTDDSVSRIGRDFREVAILRNSCNLGFAAGFNLGIRYALEHGAELVLVLNNDTWVDPSMLSLLVTAMDDPQLGAVSPVIYSAARPERIWSVGGRCHPLTVEWSDKRQDQRVTADWPAFLDRDYLVGCAILFRRELLERIGLFDEGFFMYYEDSDISLRARQAGFRLGIVRDARMWHKVAASSGGRNTPHERYWMGRSSVRFFRKQIRGLRWMAVAPYRTGSALKTMAHLLLRGRFESAGAYLHGLWDGLRDPITRDERSCAS